MSSKSQFKDFFVKVGTISAVVVCAGLLVKNFLIEAAPSKITCEQVTTGTIGVVERGRNNSVVFDLRLSDGTEEHDLIVIPSTMPLTCEAIFGDGWIDVPNED